MRLRSRVYRVGCCDKVKVEEVKVQGRRVPNGLIKSEDRSLRLMAAHQLIRTMIFFKRQRRDEGLETANGLMQRDGLGSGGSCLGLGGVTSVQLDVSRRAMAR